MAPEPRPRTTDFQSVEPPPPRKNGTTPQKKAKGAWHLNVAPERSWAVSVCPQAAAMRLSLRAVGRQPKTIKVPCTFLSKIKSFSSPGRESRWHLVDAV